jgi:quercetin dioxygenase-like cupin family protein
MPGMSEPTWPDGLDALTAAAAHHRLAMENEFVRMLETRIEPGEVVALHTHRWPAAYYILSWGDFIRRDEQGEITLDSRASGIHLEPGQSIWSAPLGPHTLENVGSAAIHLVSVEVKPPAEE